MAEIMLWGPEPFIRPSFFFLIGFRSGVDGRRAADDGRMVPVRLLPDVDFAGADKHAQSEVGRSRLLPV